nr:fumarylacetoacetate hydrolase family protein [Pelagibacterium montanilacus]
MIDPTERTTLAIEDSEAVFPVNRLFCIGRNYAAHSVEMGHDPDKEHPFFFFKHAGAARSDGQFPYPPKTADVHHEIEMVVALGKGGRDIAVADALDHVFGYGVGLDMTRRDLQAEAKKAGRPWEVAKSFDDSAPCGVLVPASLIGHPEHGAVVLKVNGEVRQQGDLNQMIWKVPEMIAILSQYFELKAGDLILTGTPAGVGPVQRGDRLEGTIEGVGALAVTVI